MNQSSSRENGFSMVIIGENGFGKSKLGAWIEKWQGAEFEICNLG